MGKRLGALLLALPLSGAGMLMGTSTRVTASAGAVLPYEGAVVAGAIPCSDSPLVLEKQELTLRIGKFPVAYSACEEQDPSCVTAEYTLYNPTENPVSLTMLLPQAPCPEYAKETAFVDYAVYLDGVPLDTAFRHSYVGYYNRTLNIENSLAQLLSEKSADAFYGGEELLVHNYVFQIDLPPESLAGIGRKYLSFVLTFDCNPEKTRVMSCNRMYSEIVNGRMQTSFDVEAGESEICLSVVGEDIAHLTYGVYTDRFREKKIDIARLAYQESEMPFFDYAMSFCPAWSGISQIDWFNGFVQMLSRNTINGYIVYAAPNSLREEAFMRWYEYELTVPAGSRIVHKTEAPIWPTVNEKTYEYSYLLSSQQRWSDFGEISIMIDTPYYLAYSTLDFEKIDGVYTFRRDCLPLGELNFTLVSSAEEYNSILNTQGYDSISPSLRLAYILLGTLGGAALISAVLGIVIYKRNQKRSYRAGTRK